MLNRRGVRAMIAADAAALLARLATMSHQDVARLYNQAEPESEEADLIAGYMELHHIDD